MGLHGWVRTGARLTARAHAVKLYRADARSRAHSNVTVDWPVDHWLYAIVAEAQRSIDGWFWKIRDREGRLLDHGQVKKEAGARRAVMTRIEKFTETIRRRPAIAELEEAKLRPLIATGYSRVAGQSAEAIAAEVLKGPLEGLAAMRAGARKAGLIP